MNDPNYRDHESPMTSTASRLVRAEHSLGTLQTEVAGIKADVSHVRQDIQSLHTIVTELAHSMSAKGTTNWGIIITASGLMLSVIIYYNSLILSPVTEKIDHHTKELELIHHRNLKREREIGADKELMKRMKDDMNFYHSLDKGKIQ